MAAGDCVRELEEEAMAARDVDALVLRLVENAPLNGLVRPDFRDGTALVTGHTLPVDDGYLIA